MVVSNDALLILFPTKKINCYCALYLKSSVVYFSPQYFVGVEISGKKNNKKFCCILISYTALLCFRESYFQYCSPPTWEPTIQKQLPGCLQPDSAPSETLPVSRFRMKFVKIFFRNHFIKVVKFQFILITRTPNSQTDSLAMTNICPVLLFQPFVFLIGKSLYVWNSFSASDYVLSVCGDLCEIWGKSCILVYEEHLLSFSVIFQPCFSMYTFSYLICLYHAALPAGLPAPIPFQLVNTLTCFNLIDC